MSYKKMLIGAGAALLIATNTSTALAVGTAITYQGDLESAGTPVDGTADFVCRLYDAAGGGALLGTDSASAVAVAGGVFTTDLDFGSAPFTDGQDLWLEIDVRSPAGAGAFETLSPRQRLRAAPHSLSTRGINVASNGNVGLGTDSPIGGLHVQHATGPAAFPGPSAGGGGIDIMAVSDDAALALMSSDGGSTGSVIQLKEIDGGGALVDTWEIVRGTSGSGSGMLFKYGTASNANPTKMTLASDGSLGIGNTAPGWQLDVLGDVAFRDRDDGSVAYVYDDVANVQIMHTRVGVNAAYGNVTMNVRQEGADSPIFRVENAAGTGYLNVDGNGDITSLCGFLCSSDARLKRNVHTLKGALDQVIALRGVSFEWNDTALAEKGVQLGFIAQEVEAVVPELVETGDNGYKSVRYGNVAPLLVEAIGEQQAEIDQLRERIADLEAMVNALLPTD